MIKGRPIMEKENLQDISLQSLQWLESRGLFGGGGGGSMHHMGSNKNINSNSGNGPNVVTSSNASGCFSLNSLHDFIIILPAGSPASAASPSPCVSSPPSKPLKAKGILHFKTTLSYSKLASKGLQNNPAKGVVQKASKIFNPFTII